jgi:hypothetical protein
MKNILLIIVTIGFVTFESYSQNDTIQLFENHILFRGEEINKIIEGDRQGKWIDFTIVNEKLTISSASGFDENGNNLHWHTMTQKEFRALQTTEKEGEKLVFSESVDSTYRNRIYHSISEVSIHSKVPPDNYYITAKGGYQNDLKTGKWTFYHDSGAVKKEIEYLNGLPTQEFKIFRETGDLIFDVTRLTKTDWKICKYSETGKLLDCEVKNIDEFRALYE